MTPKPPTPADCDHCKQPLTALARQRGLSRCEAAACRTAEMGRDLKRRWNGVAAEALRRAAQERPAALAPPLLLWLQDTGRTLVPVTEADRSWLAARWRQAWLDDIDDAPDAREATPDLAPAAAALCAHCAGRCCALGGGQAAFVDGATLRRWLRLHPGTTVDDAIAHYLASLPAQHVQAQCCFQGATGCALPREQRADICNDYQCDALSELGSAVARQADTLAVVLTRAGPRLAAAALFQHGVATPLQDVPGPHG
jgi:hypothetical protein